MPEMPYFIRHLSSDFHGIEMEFFGIFGIFLIFFEFFEFFWSFLEFFAHIWNSRHQNFPVSRPSVFSSSLKRSQGQKKGQDLFKNLAFFYSFL
jgi:hypothetical protein